MSMLVRLSGRIPTINQIAPENAGDSNREFSPMVDGSEHQLNASYERNSKSIFESQKKQRIQQIYNPRRYDDRICQTIFSLLNAKDAARVASTNHYWNRGFNEPLPMVKEIEPLLSSLKWLVDSKSKSPLKLIASIFNQLAATPEKRQRVLQCFNQGILKEKQAFEVGEGFDPELNQLRSFDDVAQGTIQERWSQFENLKGILEEMGNYSHIEAVPLYLRFYIEFIELSKEYRGEAVIYAIQEKETLLLKLLLLTGDISKKAKALAYEIATPDEKHLLDTCVGTDCSTRAINRLPCSHSKESWPLMLTPPTPFSPEFSIKSLVDLPQLLFPWLTVKDVAALSETSRKMQKNLDIYQADLLKAAECSSCFPLSEFLGATSAERIRFAREKFKMIEEVFLLVDKSYKGIFKDFDQPLTNVENGGRVEEARAEETGLEEGADQFLAIFDNGRRVEEEEGVDLFGDVERLFRERWRASSKEGEEAARKIKARSADTLISTYINVFIPLLRSMRNEYRGAAVVMAATTGNVVMLSMLLKSGVISKNARGLALIEAAASNSPDSLNMVQILLASGSIDEGGLLDDRDRKIENEEPLGIDLDCSMRSQAILAATEQGNLPVIEALLHGVQLLDYDHHMLNALKMAIKQNSISIYRALLRDDCYPRGVHQECLVLMEDLGHDEMIKEFFS